MEGTSAASLDLGGTLLRVTWLSIALGLAMEALLLVLAFGTGAFATLQPFVADLVQKVSWSVFVCVGLAFGRVISRASLALTGLSGLLAAPVAFITARTFHRAAVSTLGLTATAAGLSPFLLALIKAIEYGCLGVMVAWLARRQAGLPAYLAAGFGVAAVFGTMIVTFTVSSVGQPISTFQLLSLAINELIFPVGCALVLFATDLLIRRAATGVQAG